MNYQIGQFVVYRNAGVRQITAIGKPDFLKAESKEYYTLCPPFSQSRDRSYLPVTSESCLRPVITEKEARTYLHDLRHLSVSVCTAKTRQNLVAHYQELLSSGSLDKQLRLLKELSIKEHLRQAEGKKLAATEADFQQRVEQLICEEFSVALKELPAQTAQRLHSALEPTT